MLSQNILIPHHYWIIDAARVYMICCMVQQTNVCVIKPSCMVQRYFHMAQKNSFLCKDAF